ncbi:MAG: sulfoxide reductase heme-binding subunit YedZ [Moraxellaceae bacterium]|nr:sulfoxide reductase heme-binding subunit YedZ [Moraxellaceae bacterium]
MKPGLPLSRDWRSKLLFLLGLMLPLAWVIWSGASNRLGPDPAKALVDFFGLWAFHILLLCLAMTPLRLLTGKSFWIRYRRMLGLAAFFYALLHICSYVLLLYGGGWAEVWGELLRRPYVVVGASAFLCLLPLALTSTRSWQRRLGRRWVMLHRLVYPGALLVLLHFAWVKKLGFLAVWPYVLLLFVLLFVRLFAYLRNASFKN